MNTTVDLIREPGRIDLRQIIGPCSVHLLPPHSARSSLVILVAEPGRRCNSW